METANVNMLPGMQSYPAFYPEAAIEKVPAESSKLFSAKELGKNYRDMANLTDEVEHLRAARQKIQDRLNAVGEELKGYGASFHQFKASHLNDFSMDPNAPLNIARPAMEQHNASARHSMETDLRTEYDAKEAVKKEKYVKENLDEVLRRQQQNAHFQPKAESVNSPKTFRFTYTRKAEGASFSTVAAVVHFMLGGGFWQSVGVKLALQVLGTT